MSILLSDPPALFGGGLCAVDHRHRAKKGHLTCPACWQLVPQDLRDALYAAQEAWTEGALAKIELRHVQAQVIVSVRERLQAWVQQS